MKTFAIRNGDLVLGQGGFKTISGTTKVRQDLSMALIEEYGTDRFHPRWGSTLQRMVGHTIGPETEMIVRSEVSRVIQQYIDAQRAEVIDDKMGFKRTRFTTAEVIKSVEGVSASIRYDAIHVRVDLKTLSNDLVTVRRSVDVTDA